MIPSISNLNLRSMDVPDRSYPLIAILSNELQNRYAGPSRRSLTRPPLMNGLGGQLPRIAGATDARLTAFTWTPIC
jgi:hypothetical protein